MAQVSHGILYTITDGWGAVRGHLFGTIHVFHNDWPLVLSPSVTECFNKSKCLCVEVQPNRCEAAVLTDEQLRKNVAVQGSFFRAMKLEPGVEQHLIKLANARGGEVFELETLETQL